MSNFSKTPDGLPFLCGGYISTEEFSGYSDACYKYFPLNDSWQEMSTMPSERYDSAYTYSDGFGLVMAGGDLRDGSEMDSVILTKDGLTFETLQSLPTPSNRGCLASIGQSTLLLSGGAPNDRSYEVYSYDIAGDTWTRYHGEITVL